VTAHPEGWPSFAMAMADAEGFHAPEGNTIPPTWRGGGGPPASSGRGMQAERRRSTWEAPDTPGRGKSAQRVYSS
jgi:hypothetical protein